MNVNLVEHQRSVMATLGIDVWIPKVDVQTRVYTSSLYRDQAAPEHPVFQSFDALDSVAKFGTGQKNTEQNILAELSVIQTERVQVEQNQEDKKKAVQARSHVVDQALLKIDAFELYAIHFEHCVLVVDATHISTEQANLWRNIQSAMKGQTVALKWPFGLEPMQDGRGAKMYVQGFLDAMCVEKKLIGLGQIPHCQHAAMLEAPSLQEMLDQPVLKRILWQMMQK